MPLEELDYMRRKLLRPRLNLFPLCLFAVLSISLILKFRKHNSSLWSNLSAHPPSVQLVLAATRGTELGWARQLKVRNLEVIPYIADDPSAPYHPPENKGNEAMVYLTYLYAFYDKLPDISIFAHGDDRSWHVDSALESSTAYAIEHLDLNEILQRQYVNLRVSWENACPNWINTSVTGSSPQYKPHLKAEEQFMKQAFLENFPGDPVPQILSQPCCSQFAVTKEVIRSIPRSQFQLQINWLRAVGLGSEISGRVWEHLWQWMFLKKAIDCPVEYKALCRYYHICFEGEQDLGNWKEHDASMDHLIKQKEEILEGGNPLRNAGLKKLDQQIKEYNDHLELWKQKAIERGKSEKKRIEIAGDL